MKTRILLLTVLSAFLFFLACQRQDNTIALSIPHLPDQPFKYAELDDDVAQFVNTAQYEVTDAGATLGRVLFYDKILSLDNSIACASCHLQEKGFADVPSFSKGIDGQELGRHTMALSNQYNDPLLFWDGRSESLKDLVLKPVRNHKEMGLDNMDFLVAKIRKADYYQPLFESAFGDQEVTRDRIADAMAQFLSSMVSYRSKNDKWTMGNATLTQLEMDGHNIFFGEGRCYQCHGGTDFNTRGFFFEPPINGTWGLPAANIGLDEEYADQGFGLFEEEMEGLFKIPSLRNVEYTAPYMHDGRFATLDDVIEHYNSGIKDHPNLDFSLRDWNTDGPMRLNLSEYNKQALKAFLLTLSDEDFVSDPKFADPFGE